MSATNNSKPAQPRLAIIAALQQEIAAIVRGWGYRDTEYGGGKLRFYESERAVVVCGGIGPQAARRAAQAALIIYHPKALVSAGFAGGLNSGMKVGDAFHAASIVDFDSGDSYAGSSEGGNPSRTAYKLVTANKIAGPAEKQYMSKELSADAVDMEAAAVAAVASQAKIAFFAVKAISDDLQFPLPPMDRFINDSGHFATGKFVLYAAIRPAMWPVVFRLARNSSRAAKALEPLLQHLIENQESPANAIESKVTHS